MIDRIHTFDECFLIRYSNVSRCLKLLKRAQFHNNAIIIMVNRDSSFIDKEKLISIVDDIFRLQQNQQIQSILVIYINENDKNLQIHFVNDALKNVSKVIGVFHNHETMLIRFQQLLNTFKNSNDGLFSIFNSRCKSLRDVRNELGPFVWYQSNRG